MTAAENAAEEREYALTCVRYRLRLALDPAGNPAEKRRIEARIKAAGDDELRELADELDCPKAADALAALAAGAGEL